MAIGRIWGPIIFPLIGLRECKGLITANNSTQELKTGPEEVKTRPDTLPPVRDGWAGAKMRVFTLSILIITDKPMD